MSKSKAEMADVAERRKHLVRLRRARVEFDDPRILGLGYSSASHASKDLIRALKIRRDDQAAEVSIYRQEAKEQIGELLAGVWPAATTPVTQYDDDGEPTGQSVDLRAVEQARQLIDRLIKLDGLDAPVRTELSGPDGGAVPLSSGTLDELNQLISIAGQTGPELAEVGDDSDDSS